MAREFEALRSRAAEWRPRRLEPADPSVDTFEERWAPIDPLRQLLQPPSPAVRPGSPVWGMPGNVISQAPDLFRRFGGQPEALDALRQAMPGLDLSRPPVAASAARWSRAYLDSGPGRDVKLRLATNNLRNTLGVKGDSNA